MLRNASRRPSPGSTTSATASATWVASSPQETQQVPNAQGQPACFHKEEEIQPQSCSASRIQLVVMVVVVVGPISFESQMSVGRVEKEGRGVGRGPLAVPCIWGGHSFTPSFIQGRGGDG